MHQAINYGEWWRLEESLFLYAVYLLIYVLKSFLQLLLYLLPFVINYRILNAVIVGQICIDFYIDYLVTQLYDAAITSIFISDATQNQSAFHRCSAASAASPNTRRKNKDLGTLCNTWYCRTELVTSGTSSSALIKLCWQRRGADQAVLWADFCIALRELWLLWIHF